MWNRRAPIADLGAIGGPVEGEVTSPRNPGLSEDRAVEHVMLHEIDEVLQCPIADFQLTQALRVQTRQLVWVCRTPGKFRSSPGLAQRIDQKLLRIPVMWARVGAKRCWLFSY